MKDHPTTNNRSAICLTLGWGIVTQNSHFTTTLPERLGLSLRCDECHIGASNHIVDHDQFPYHTPSTHLAKERADQLIQFFNDPHTPMPPCHQPA